MSSRSIPSLLRFWRSSSLAFRLTAWYTAATFLLIVLSTGILYLALSANLERNIDQFLADKVHVLTALLRDRPNDVEGLREEIELESAARRYESFYIRLLDEHGRPILTTPGMDRLLDTGQFARAALRVANRSFRIKSIDGRTFRGVVATAFAGAGQDAARTMQVAVDLTQQEELLVRYRTWLWAILALTFVACPLIGFQIARRGIHFVKDVAATARRIGSTTLNERIQPEGYPVELVDLARTFNAMLDRLEDSFARLSRFSADIAHELRTPVNNIRGEAEVALARARSVEEYRDVVGSCLEEAVKLSDLIASLLFLARSENPATGIKREVVDVGELLGRVREYYEGSAAESGVAIVAQCGDRTTVEADRALLQRAVGNLVSNAIANTPPSGTIRLTADPGQAQVRIEVADNGAGIPPQDLAHVFDRFYRIDPARSQSSGGAGLGLAIVKGIMNLHGGRVEIDSTLGQGTRVTLVLPC